MAILPHPPDLPGNPSDKLQHIVTFATLAGLGTFAYPQTPLFRLFAGLSLFGALIEVVQAIPILHRDSDFWDWIADTIAAALCLLLVALGRTLHR